MNGRKLDIPIDKIIKLYENGESSHSIAKLFNVYHSTILLRFKKHGFKLRSKSEANKIGFKKGRIKIKKHTLPEFSKMLSKEKAYILGALCGDGWLYLNPKKRAYQIGLSVTDKEFAKKFSVSLFKVFEIKTKLKKVKVKIPNWNDKYTVILCCKDACNDLLSYGISFKTKEWSVPESIKNASIEEKASFLRGFFDSEGSVDIGSRRIRATSSNLNGLSGTKILLESIGIRSKIDLKSSKKAYDLKIQDRRSVEIFEKNIEFTIRRKKERLNEIVKNYKLYVTPHEKVRQLIPEMIKLKTQGLNCTEISKKLNLSLATIWNNLQKVKKDDELCFRETGID